MVHGINPAAGFVLGVLGLKPDDVPRFRDAWIEPDGPKLVVYTRTGGGNREEYETENAAMGEVAWFLGDHDDDFDSTYAYFEYAVPEDFAETVRVMLEIGAGKVEKPAEAWARCYAELASGKLSERTAATVEALRPVFDQIAKEVAR
jgi:hypothetical protein